jgi:hypothetical protein
MEDHRICFPALCDDEEQEGFLYLTHTNDGGLVFETWFETKDNLEVEIEDCYMYLKNAEGDMVKIEILYSKNIER